MPDSIVPLNLDPREPAPTSSPRSTSRPPTRSFTPHSSRPASPHPPSHLSLPGSSGGGSHFRPDAAGSFPPSPISPSASGHFAQHGREEGEDSSIFERDVEAAVPVSLTSSTSSAAPTAAVTAPPSPTASPLGASKVAVHHHAAAAASPSPSAHIHHPVTRASVTDRIFPTVLDDAVEALTSSAQGGGDVFVVSASQSPSRDHSPSRVFRRDVSPGGAGSPPELRERDRRESGVSLAGQAGKLLSHDADGGPPSSPDSPDGGAGGPSALLHASSLDGRLSSLSPSHSPWPGGSPAHSPRLTAQSLQLPSSPHSPPVLASPSASSASPHSAAGSGGQQHHALSFVSPQDLITSPPLSTQSLASITSGASLVPLIGGGSTSSAAGGVDNGLGDVWSSSSQAGSPAPAGGRAGSHRSQSAGEWERGGLGKGLEERLEQLAVRERRDGREPPEPAA